MNNSNDSVQKNSPGGIERQTYHADKIGTRVEDLYTLAMNQKVFKFAWTSKRNGDLQRNSYV